MTVDTGKKGQGYTLDGSNPFSINIIYSLSFLSVPICEDIRQLA
ncbi:unnamed protein product [marine sediment metagenome]|uniref:Uncharacterized protein n=1 Tax=marine sediment metagenome TaxID=412755 RepID=X0WPS2_9ZZZZ